MIRLFKNPEYFGIAIAVLSAAIFGLYPPATRAVYADGGNAAFILLFTTFWRAATLAGYCLVRGHSIFKTQRDCKFGFVTGVLQTLSIIGILGGMAFLPGPIIITLMFSYPVILYVWLVIRAEERLEATTLIPLLCAFAGLTLVLDIYSAAGLLVWQGVALGGMAAVVTAARSYIFSNLMRADGKNPAVVGAEAFLATLVFVCVYALFQHPVLPQSMEGWLWISLAAASLSAGTFGLFYGIALLGAFKNSFYLKTEPLFGAVFSVLLIGETLSAGQYVGMLLVVGSLTVYQWMQGRKA